MLGRKRYTTRYDPLATEGWFRNTVLKGPMLFLPVRTDNAFTIAMLSTNPWIPWEFECHNLLTCADEGCIWEVLALLRATIEWARKRKVTWWKIASDTEFDLAPIARRLGATEQITRLALRLNE